MPPKTGTRQGSTTAAANPASAPKPATTAETKPEAVKETKTQPDHAATLQKAGIDLSKLTPEQLVALQKKLKEKKKETSGNRKAWTEVVDRMLAEKSADGKEFKHTTREILAALVEAKLVNDTTTKGWDVKEIKHIQARKQLLEKSTDDKGKLVHPEGTFGYKASTSMGFVLTSSKISEWFTNPENVAKLGSVEKAAIMLALK